MFVKLVRGMRLTASKTRPRSGAGFIGKGSGTDFKMFPFRLFFKDQKLDFFLCGIAVFQKKPKMLSPSPQKVI